jgi:co-chaperonin GroES (HSP10)
MIEAIGKRLIIERVETEKKTTSGIVLQYDHTQSPRARVVSIGDEVTIKIAVGEEVVPDWNKVMHTKHDNRDYFVIDQNEIYGRYTEVDTAKLGINYG